MREKEEYTRREEYFSVVWFKWKRGAKMSFVQIDDLECECDNKNGLGELNMKTTRYKCLRCGE